MHKRYTPGLFYRYIAVAAAATVISLPTVKLSYADEGGVNSGTQKYCKNNECKNLIEKVLQNYIQIEEARNRDDQAAFNFLCDGSLKLANQAIIIEPTAEIAFLIADLYMFERNYCDAARFYELTNKMSSLSGTLNAGMVNKYWGEATGLCTAASGHLGEPTVRWTNLAKSGELAQRQENLYFLKQNLSPMDFEKRANDELKIQHPHHYRIKAVGDYFAGIGGSVALLSFAASIMLVGVDYATMKAQSDKQVQATSLFNSPVIAGIEYGMLVVGSVGLASLIISWPMTYFGNKKKKTLIIPEIVSAGVVKPPYSR